MDIRPAYVLRASGGRLPLPIMSCARPLQITTLYTLASGANRAIGEAMTTAGAFKLDRRGILSGSGFDSGEHTCYALLRTC